MKAYILYTGDVARVELQAQNDTDQTVLEFISALGFTSIGDNGYIGFFHKPENKTDAPEPKHRGRPKRRHMSVEARARISKGLKASWRRRKKNARN